MNPDADCLKAIELARRSVPPGGEIEPAVLLAALFHATAVRGVFPELAPHIEPPKEVRDSTPERVPVSESLAEILKVFEDRKTPVSPGEVFAELVDCVEGREALLGGGMEEKEYLALLTRVHDRVEESAPAPAPGSGWKSSSERRRAIEALAPFGRMLTAEARPGTGLAHKEDDLRKLVRILRKRKQRNAFVVGYPGTGKTALVYELARRIATGDGSIPDWLGEMDVFELSPTDLRAGASLVGEYEKRMKALLEVLKAHPRIILFVDEVHSLLQNGMRMRGPFSQANESLKAPLASGEITCIGCTTTAEYRHYIEGDQALERRFSTIRLEPPTPQMTVEILSHRLPGVERHYSPLRIPEDLIRRTVELSEEHLPTLHQPAKAIRLLDEACAFCAVAAPPQEELTEETLFKALEEMTGQKLVPDRPWSEDEVYERLRSKIVGQDEALHGITRAFVAGLGSRTWSSSSRPRGVFLFGGPTGVGKTETAPILAEVLGHGREQIIRIDCNTLQGSGHDGRATDWRLLGSPPGYIGHDRQGGLLSRIRDNPNSIVLFDELEKADPGLGRTLLQVLDDGYVEDNSGALLDFRRAFLVFTTNAGCSYGRRATLGFTPEQEDEGPRAEIEAIRADLGAVLGMEFLGRISHTFLFDGLGAESIAEIMDRQLRRFRAQAETRDLEFEWEPAVVDHLVSRWEPRFGARYLTMILRHRVEEQLGVAEAQGELDGVRSIRLSVLAPEQAVPGLAGAVRKREGEALVICLA